MPHADKHKAEQLLQENTQVKEKIVVSAALLTDGESRGWGDSSSYCIAQEGKCRGYTISRRDVGEFVATQAVRGGTWVNKSVVISSSQGTNVGLAANGGTLHADSSVVFLLFTGTNC